MRQNNEGVKRLEWEDVPPGTNVQHWVLYSTGPQTPGHGLIPGHGLLETGTHSRT